MHADICDREDAAAVARLRVALRSVGAEMSGQYWALGVDAYRCRVGTEAVTIFSDAYLVDIEGPDGLVRRITSLVAAQA